VYLNDSELFSCSGEDEGSYSIGSVSSGDVLRFEYSKDGSGDTGGDCVYFDVLYSNGQTYTFINESGAVWTSNNQY
jgi:hypothetical protein